ncbi:hypothetical protein EMCRGX_G032539 [Ephydatia muelleri]
MDVPIGVLQCTPSTDKKLFDATVSGSAAQCGDKFKSRLAVQMETAVRDEENLAVVPVSHGRREETLFSSTAAEDCCIVPETPPQNAPSVSRAAATQVFSKDAEAVMNGSLENPFLQPHELVAYSESAAIGVLENPAALVQQNELMVTYSESEALENPFLQPHELTITFSESGASGELKNPLFQPHELTVTSGESGANGALKSPLLLQQHELTVPYSKSPAKRATPVPATVSEMTASTVHECDTQGLGERILTMWAKSIVSCGQEGAVDGLSLCEREDLSRESDDDLEVPQTASSSFGSLMSCDLQSATLPLLPSSPTNSHHTSPTSHHIQSTIPPPQPCHSLPVPLPLLLPLSPPQPSISLLDARFSPLSSCSPATTSDSGGVSYPCPLPPQLSPLVIPSPPPLFSLITPRYSSPLSVPLPSPISLPPSVHLPSFPFSTFSKTAPHLISVLLTTPPPPTVPTTPPLSTVPTTPPPPTIPSLLTTPPPPTVPTIPPPSTTPPPPTVPSTPSPPTVPTIPPPPTVPTTPPPPTVPTTPPPPTVPTTPPPPTIPTTPPPPTIPTTPPPPTVPTTPPPPTVPTTPPPPTVPVAPPSVPLASAPPTLPTQPTVSAPAIIIPCALPLHSTHLSPAQSLFNSVEIEVSTEADDTGANGINEKQGATGGATDNHGLGPSPQYVVILAPDESALGNLNCGDISNIDMECVSSLEGEHTIMVGDIPVVNMAECCVAPAPKRSKCANQDCSVECSDRSQYGSEQLLTRMQVDLQVQSGVIAQQPQHDTDEGLSTLQQALPEESARGHFHVINPVSHCGNKGWKGNRNEKREGRGLVLVDHACVVREEKITHRMPSKLISDGHAKDSTVSKLQLQMVPSLQQTLQGSSSHQLGTSCEPSMYEDDLYHVSKADSTPPIVDKQCWNIEEPSVDFHQVPTCSSLFHYQTSVTGDQQGIHLNLSRPKLRLGLSKKQRCRSLHNGQ